MSNKFTEEQQFFIDKELEFAEELYNKSDEQVQEFHKDQKKNRDDILTEIAKILLSYTIINGIVCIKDTEKNSLYSKLSKLVKDKLQSELKNETKLTKELLKNTGVEKYNTNNYLYGLGVDYNLTPVNEGALDKVINTKVEKKLWSDRLWDNKNATAKDLKREIKDFLTGKTNVNEIETKIKKKYNSNAYNTKRLVQDNIARVQEGVNDVWREEHDIKHVLYMATLCHNTCANCIQYDGKSYEVTKKPVSLPQHCFCRCTYVSIPNPDWRPKMRLDNETKEKINWRSYQDWHKNKPLIMNLQLFGYIKDKNNIINLINRGLLDENKFKKFYGDFNDMFKKEIVTPMETLKNSKDRAYHIAFKHRNLMNELGLERIKETLKNPDLIRKAIDINGSENNGYIKNFNNKLLLVIAKNDIITAYYPSQNYIKNKIQGWDIIWDKK